MLGNAAFLLETDAMATAEQQSDHPLKRWLAQRGLTQRQGAQMLGITETRLNQVANGQCRASRDMLDRLRLHCGLAADAVLDWERDHLSPQSDPSMDALYSTGGPISSDKT